MTLPDWFDHEWLNVNFIYNTVKWQYKTLAYISSWELASLTVLSVQQILIKLSIFTKLSTVDQAVQFILFALKK